MLQVGFRILNTREEVRTTALSSSFWQNTTYLPTYVSILDTASYSLSYSAYIHLTFWEYVFDYYFRTTPYYETTITYFYTSADLCIACSVYVYDVLYI